MRYAILRNATPPGQASLRLRIDAGSLMENENQQGLAHFMEHMAFNGTTNIPENELLRILERLGLAFGADTNASTGFDQTIYQLDLPRTNDETVDAGLRIMREQVSEALMAADADRRRTRRDRRRGAHRATRPGLRSLKAQLALLAPGQRISRAPADRRPEHHPHRAARAVRRILQRLLPALARDVRSPSATSTSTRWRPRSGAPSRAGSPRPPTAPSPTSARSPPRQPETKILVEPGIQSSIQLNWITAPDRDPDTVAERARAIWSRASGLPVLNRRLGELARADNPPFISASGGASDPGRQPAISASCQRLASIPAAGSARSRAVEQEQRRLVQFGVTEAELQREITDTRTALQNAVAGAATRRTPGLADESV